MFEGFCQGDGLTRGRRIPTAHLLYMKGPEKAIRFSAFGEKFSEGEQPFSPTWLGWLMPPPDGGDDDAKPVPAPAGRQRDPGAHQSPPAAERKARPAARA